MALEGSRMSSEVQPQSIRFWAVLSESKLALRAGGAAVGSEGPERKRGDHAGLPRHAQANPLLRPAAGPGRLCQQQPCRSR